MAASAGRCPGCGAEVAESDGPRHAYLPATAGCWALYATLEDWKAGLGGDGGVSTIQDLVDGYAAQHADSPDRRNRQSVAVHLMSLCAGIEQGSSGRQRRARIASWAHRDYPALHPAAGAFPITVSDVAAASAQDRGALVARMAAATWVAWAAHHGTVRRWLAEQAATAPRGRPR